MGHRVMPVTGLTPCDDVDGGKTAVQEVKAGYVGVRAGVGVGVDVGLALALDGYGYDIGEERLLMQSQGER